MKIKLIILLTLFSSMLLFENCKTKKINYKFNDKNCVIGNEEQVKANRFIGMLKQISNKAQMIVLGVKPNTYIIKFSDSTVWKFSKKITNKKILIKKKGCIAVDFKKNGTEYLALTVKVLPPYQVPKNQLINTKQLLAFMGSETGIKNDITLIDSRPKAKWLQGSIPGSINIPLSVLKKETGFKLLPKDKTVIFYCGGFHCKLAPFSGRLAVKKGYKKVKVYHAGYPGWKKAGKVGVVRASYLIKLQKQKMPVILLDLRKNAAKEHIPGAYAISTEKIDSIKAMLPKNPKARKLAPVILYGNEAFKAGKAIISMGMKNVLVLHGGLKAYKKSGGIPAQNKLIKKINFKLKKAPGEISAIEFYNIIKKGIPNNVVILDVRSEAEIASMPGITILGKTKNIPLTELKSKALTLDKNKTYYTFCATGMRAALARDILSDLGFKNVYFVNAKISNPDGGLKIGNKVINNKELEKFTGKKIKKKKYQFIKSEGC